jgi:hypothetical protein
MAQRGCSTRSNNPNTTGKTSKQPQFADRKRARAHRADTPEGRLMRHDTSGGGGGRK